MNHDVRLPNACRSAAPLAVFGDHSNLKRDIAASAHSKKSHRPFVPAFGEAQFRAGLKESLTIRP